MLLDTLGNVFKQQGVRRIDHVVDVRASRRLAKTAIFGTPTCAIASKLPQLILLTPLVHKLPKLYIFPTVRNRLHEGGLYALRPYVGCVLARRHCVIRFNWVRTHQRWPRQQRNSVLFSDKSRFIIHLRDGRVRVYRRRNECT